MTALLIPEPCQILEEFETEQGLGKQPNNDEPLQVLHHHRDRLDNAGQAFTEYPYPAKRAGQYDRDTNKSCSQQ